MNSIAKINGREKYLKLWKLDAAEKQAEEFAEEITKERVSRGEIFSFTKCHIPQGAILEYINNPEITCTVVDDRKISYQGEVMYMTTLAKMLTGKAIGIAGPAFFRYNGKNLQEYYNEYQAKNNLKSGLCGSYVVLCPANRRCDQWKAL